MADVRTNPGTGVDIFIGEDTPGEYGPWVEVGRNTCVNPSFESNLDDVGLYTPSNGLNTRVSGLSTRHGNWALKFEATLATGVARRGSSVALSKTYQVGDQVPISADIMIPSVGAPAMTGEVWLLVGGSNWAVAQLDVNIRDQWQRVSGVVDVQSVSDRCFVGLSAAWAVGDFFYIDNIRVGESGSYVDGNTAGSDARRSSWVGAPNNSATIIEERETLVAPAYQDAIWSSAAHSIQEESTPVDPADTTGAYGQISATIRTHDTVRSYRDKRLDLSDGAQGKTTGTIRGLSGNQLSTTLTADSRLAQIAVTRTAQPFVGPLGDALRYYLGLCGVTEDIVIDVELNLLPVQLLGWRGNVYDQIKRLGPAFRFETTLVSNMIVFRPFRGRVAETYRDSDVTWTVDATGLAQRVEGYSYNLENGTLLAYPYGGWNEDVTVYTVDAGQTTTVELPIDGSLSSVEQPTCVAFVSRNHASSSVYSVSGNDGIAIQPAQWAAGGGSLTVEIGEDTRTLSVTIKAPAETEYAPYRIGVSSGPSDYYSSLRLIGTGVFFTKELVSLPAALDPDRAPQEIGATVDNEFFADGNQLHHALLWSATRFAMARMTVNVTTKGINRRGDSGSLVFPTIGELKALNLGDTIGEIYTELGPTIWDWNNRLIELVGNDFENQAYGNIGGARVIHDDCWFRIRTATVTPAQVTYTAEWDNTVGDVYHYGETIGEWKARWAGKTIRDVNEAPLQGVEVAL